MAAAIKLRDDFSAEDVRAFARRSKEAAQVRRLLGIATILDGGSRSDAARVGGVTLQIVRDWVLRFNEAGPDGLMTRKSPGSGTILDDRHRRALEEAIEAGPIPAVHGVVHRRIIDLVQWLRDEFAVSSASRHRAVNCAPWVIASSSSGRAIAVRSRRVGAGHPIRVSRASGANPQGPAERYAHRTVVGR